MLKTERENRSMELHRIGTARGLRFTLARLLSVVAPPQSTAASVLELSVRGDGMSWRSTFRVLFPDFVDWISSSTAVVRGCPSLPQGTANNNGGGAPTTVGAEDLFEILEEFSFGPPQACGKRL